MPSEIKGLHQLEDENARLKRIVADLLARQGDAAGCHQAKALGHARRRQLVDHLRAAWQVSIRHAYGPLQAERSSYHYKGKRTDPAALKKRIKGIAETRAHHGHRRITALLKREDRQPASRPDLVQSWGQGQVQSRSGARP